MRYSDFVDYGKLDPFKRMALEKLSETFKAPERLGIRVVPESLGEPASLFDFLGYDFMLAFVVEGLGTKNLIAEKMAVNEKAFGRRFYDGLGQDVLATAINELPCVGATPFAYGDEVAVGSSSWFDDKARAEQFIDSLASGCMAAKVAVPCGETPALCDIVFPETASLSGGAIGLVRPKSRAMWGQGLKGDEVIFGIGSSGIHTNGITLARKIAERLPDGYFTELPNGNTLGEALLKPTHIYSPLIEDLWEDGVEIRYISNITGHGWRKIMRAKRDFTYRISHVPEPPPELSFLQEVGGVSDEEAYQVWNMGVGYCIFSTEDFGEAISSRAEKRGLRCYALGRLVPGERKVVIEPKAVTYFH
ncbi:MAG: phosphoribosylformylglycinamidine cyclo-ligase [Candidatus Brockarchaeota archaeon]|nr:phosphoribosylformylglycinamidine cyclo-ligase [Candidatus Brockarchaeota archaeon]